MHFSWQIFIDIGILSLGLLLATFIRSKVIFFQKYLIPNSLTAGFILLPLYNFVLPELGIESGGLGELVYHLLSLSFISMTLRKAPKSVGTSHADKKRNSRNVFATSMSVMSQYGLQAFLGLIITYVLMVTVLPNLFPSFGFLMPLGFVLGPGQAFAIGTGWEGFGFEGAGTVGLTFAAIGFIWASFGGVFLINYGIRRHWLKREQVEKITARGVRTGVYPRGAGKPEGSKLTTESEAVDSMTFNTAVVMATYLLSYLLLQFLTWLLSFAGNMGQELAVNLWGISFIFAAVTAMAVRGVIRGLKVDYVLDNGTLTRLAGISVDLMVTASIAAISLVVVKNYWLPILIMSTVGGGLALVLVPWFCSRIFRDHRFHRTLMIYGVSTGTLPTGLALLRVIDPDFETPVASQYMVAAGITFMLAIPFILAINLPVYSYTTGNQLFFWLGVLVSFAYIVFVGTAFLFISRKRAARTPGKIWYRNKGEQA
jgi:ESS family glutamate:Na+ symporter